MGIKPAIVILISLSVSFLTLASEARADSSFPDGLLSGPGIWHDQDNLEHHLSDWSGRPIVLTTFYTECKKTCPMLTLAKLKELQAALISKNQPVDFLLLTMDPEKDTPATLAQYKKNHGIVFPNWYLLQGTEKETRQLTKKLGMGDYWSMDDHILHKFRILYLDPTKNFRRVLDWEHQDVNSIFETSPPSASSQSPDLSRKTQ